MTSRKAPVFRQLAERECEMILKRNHVGRMAFALHSRVEIEPIGFVKVGRWLYGRTSHGTKLDVVGHQPWVAFEVDEIDDMFNWRSVVVHGVCRELRNEGSALDKRRYRRALAAIRRIVADAFTENDPVPERSVLFGIHIDTMVGRAAKTKV